MAYVQPREAPRDLVAAVWKQGARVLALTAYATAVAVALVLLAPVLFGGDSNASARVPSGPEPVAYTLEPGDSLPAVAAGHGLSLARLFALNPDLTPLSAPNRQKVVVALR